MISKSVFEVVDLFTGFISIDEALVSLIVRESISAFFLLLVLVGVFRLLSRLIDVLDDHLGEIETEVGQIGLSLEACLRELRPRDR